MKELDIRQDTFYFDGCNTVELAKKYGTPLYVFSETEIVRRLRELKAQFVEKYANVRVAYAAKAFFTLYMARLLEKEEMCVDVVSGGELYTAIKAGFPPERIEFNGNNKLREEIELAVEYGIGRIIIDGTHELELIEDVCREKGKTIDVMYRLTPGVKSSTHDYIVTGKKDSKFGLPIEDEIIFPAIENAVRSPYVKLMGFHFHVGSQLFDNDSHVQALSIILDLAKRAYDRLGFVTKEINLGGGFGVTYVDEERKPFSYFLDPMMKMIEAFAEENHIDRPAVVIEPGRSIVAETGITLYTVGSIKTIPGIRTYVSVDGGMTDNIRPALYQAEYTGIVANRASEKCQEKVTICGKCCESGDVLIKDLEVPDIKTGDTFAVFSTGAYGYSMANNYNKLPMPAVVAVKDGKDKLIVKRQTFDDLLRNEL